MKQLLAISFAFVTLAWSPFAVSAQETSLQDLLNASSLWTREYLITLSDNLPNQATQAFEKKLHAYQNELSSRLEPYYGAKVVQELTELLKTQGVLLVDITNATKLRDTKKHDAIKQSLQLNATSISSLLSKVNPYINFCDIRDMLFDYVTLLSTMIADRVNTKWQEDIENYEKARAKNNQIASYIAQAMTNAFPQQPPAQTSCSAPQASRVALSQPR